ncbi:unnamed protein product [Adineta ricciae]|uniref:Uncharacterized protein n=1 Tax=Adineta ricciae TaxID=249248 RepID=A0A814WK14_ADIRI|nr:unnamed protein product [Adineta ricciae]
MLIFTQSYRQLQYNLSKGLIYDRLLGEICYNGQIDKRIQQSVLRSVVSSISRSTREDNPNARSIVLRKQNGEGYVPLKNISAEANIHWFAADVTLTQIYFNEESNSIEAVYVFPIEESAAIYEFTAQIDDRTIRAVLKEKEMARQEYNQAMRDGKTAVLLEQSHETYDTFQINVGHVPPGKECIVKIRYVTELDLIDGKFIRFVIPTTISPRYNPKLGSLQSPNGQRARYVQNTPYSMFFRVTIDRSEQNKIQYIANLSHPVNVSVSNRMIEVTSEGIALDRDIILDIDLPSNRPAVLFAVEQCGQKSHQYAILTALTPNSEYISNKTHDKKQEIKTLNEFIFIVDCSGSMNDEQKIDLARQAMLLFLRGLPVDSYFNIIRYGSTYHPLFPNKTISSVYNQTTVEQAEKLIQSMAADLGGTELLEPLKYLKNHPPDNDRFRNIFLLTDGEVSNTNEIIALCASMSSTTRIFSFGLGYSPSRALVKALAQATKGTYVFVPPNSAVDQYVAIQLRHALSNSFSKVHFQWHGLSTTPIQSPQIIPPVYANDRVLIYTLLANSDRIRKETQVDLIINDNQGEKIDVTISDMIYEMNTIHRLAAKSLIKELLYGHANQNHHNRKKVEQQIIKLSLRHQILSPFTAFVGIEENKLIQNNQVSNTRYVPIQISRGDEHLLDYSSAQSVQQGGFLKNIMRIGTYPVQSFTAEQHVVLSKSAVKRARKIFEQNVTSTTKNSSLTRNSVQWLIEHQSYNGMWILNDDDIKQLTKGKSWIEFQSTITHNKDIITTSLVIALLESKYADQLNLWILLTEKARNQMINLGLNKDNINSLIQQIKDKF